MLVVRFGGPAKQFAVFAVFLVTGNFAKTGARGPGAADAARRLSPAFAEVYRMAPTPRCGIAAARQDRRGASSGEAVRPLAEAIIPRPRGPAPSWGRSARGRRKCRSLR